MQVFVGSMMLVGFNFAPTGFAVCAGQLMGIAQNAALFSLLGTQYGGDGRTTFALPNLQGSLAVGQGQGPGLKPYVVGQPGGSPAVTLLQNTVPPHGHSVLGAKGGGTGASPNGTALAQAPLYATASNPQMAAMNSAALGPPVGSGQPHNNMMPSLGLTWIIALQGIFPQRP